MMPAAILAGGLATRLRPVTESLPKALVRIKGRAFIDYQLELLASDGIDCVVLCLGYLGEMVREYIGGERFGIEVRYSFDGDKLLGTGGAIKKALPLLGEKFFILYGDSYLPIDFKDVEEAFAASGKRALMTVYRNDGQWDKSNAVYEPITPRVGIVRVYDKANSLPAMNYIDYGLSCCDASVFVNEVADIFDLAGVFSRISREGGLAGFEAEHRFYEIGSHAGIEDFADYIDGMNNNTETQGYIGQKEAFASGLCDLCRFSRNGGDS
jgi:NDP-sugar pyrophosphorylase family protein